ncbi:phosphonate C-P lyase system protein PhnL [Sedimenticola hydrogenitrophicus]|uniref:phosphonate C-P lyase system protein PhnL n=1 Tax=Sedimenticola hydrogenitrophicus TaxID=2967975 RepID=UPI0023AECE9D|nr:phosphonate C-P lyase system protein PhnL [Sedimenticola hydrogenitrophicus]
MQPVLKVEALSKQFQLYEQGKLIPSCADVHLEVQAGALTALIGPTGAGKSSVLKCIHRTYLPTSGRMLYRDRDNHVTDLALASEHRILELRHSDIGFVTQFLHCLPRKAALDVVAEPLLARGEGAGGARERAAELLALLNVPERLWGVPPATFSGGEKQRVNLARGLIARPRLLLLDEPTASLDPATTGRVVDLIERIKAEGVAMLAIFHQPELVNRLADRVVELTPPVAATELLETCTS